MVLSFKLGRRENCLPNFSGPKHDWLAVIANFSHYSDDFNETTQINTV